jgi:hypothetical protein
MQQQQPQRKDFVIWVDLENVRGKTGFAWSHDHVLQLVADWAHQRNVTQHVVVVADHGSFSQAWWDADRNLAVVFSGDAFAKADDVLARFVNLEFLLPSSRQPQAGGGMINGGGHSVIVTADTELQSRCRRASKDNSYQFLDPAKFIDELEAVEAMIERERQQQQQQQ